LLLIIWLAIGLRLDVWGLPQQHGPLLIHLLAPVVILPVFWYWGLYRMMMRFMGNYFVPRIALMATVAMLLYVGILTGSTLMTIPRSVLLIAWLLLLLYITASRFALQKLYSALHIKKNAARKRAIIYGAGDAGRQLMRILKMGTEYNPVLFVDDNEQLHELDVMNLKVKKPADLPWLVREHAVASIFLAIPSLHRSRRLEIINQLESLHVKIQVVPSIADVVGGKIRITDVQDIDIDDLLGRAIVPPVEALLAADLARKVVMVTGAGGSIGAELCRQIVGQQPTTLILFDHSEFALYQIHAELSQKMLAQDVRLVPVLGSVSDEALLSDVLQKHRVQTLYHAAAYKHVPLVQLNSVAGVRNNVFGTQTTLCAALAAKVETFVLISTDKAVRPSNVMGASKRCAELIVQTHAQEHAQDPACPTRLVVVRFGNVLGSSGSVIPLFHKQIALGGPVTLTDPEVSRYFMTIPEAAQLVIQAGAMARGGEVFVLDMGEPVKIADLARRMIHLSGFVVSEGDEPHENGIRIDVIGLRPGEKLHEELFIGERIQPTKHPKIMVADEPYVSSEELHALLERLQSACVENDDVAVCDVLNEKIVAATSNFQTREHDAVRGGRFVTFAPKAQCNGAVAGNPAVILERA